MVKKTTTARSSHTPDPAAAFIAPNSDLAEALSVPPQNRPKAPSKSKLSVQQEKAKTEALFASIGEGIIATDGWGKIIRVNQAAVDILSCSKKDLIGKWFPEVVMAVRPDGSIMDSIDRPITKAVVRGETITEKLAYMTNEGRIVPVSVTVSPVLLHGKPAGAIEIFRDITVEMQSEKLKTDFISIASHQLRTPLSAIALYTQMLHDGLAGPLNNQQVEFLETTIAATKRMNDLISTLLNITRIEAGSIAIEPRLTDLAPLVHGLVNEFIPEAEQKMVNLHFEPLADDLTIHSDTLLVREVLSNLVSNAIKYTPNGGKVAITVVEKGPHVLFSVKDTGYGIPVTSQQYIFTKFFRADNIITQDVSGTGLGLFLAKAIIENLQGELWFESKEGEGSTFCFTLPVRGIAKRKGSFKIEAR